MILQYYGDERRVLLDNGWEAVQELRILLPISVDWAGEYEDCCTYKTWGVDKRRSFMVRH
jgi:hypothetical protein